MVDFPEGWDNLEPPAKEIKKAKSLGNLVSHFLGRIMNVSSQVFTSKSTNYQEVYIPDTFQKTIEDVVIHLKNIKNEVKTQSDTELYSFVDGAIEAIIKNVKRIDKMMVDKGSAATQENVLKKCYEWMDRAQPWIQLNANAYNKAEVINAIVQHVLSDSFDLINRDLQIVEDYKEHILDHLVLHKEEKHDLNDKLKEALEPYIKALHALKEKPSKLEFSELNTWKKIVNLQREDYFEKALHVIDNLINEVAPNISKQEEHEYLVDILNQIARMEEEVSSILQEIEQQSEQGILQHKLFEFRLIVLEEDNHKLNLDLRLTPDLEHRLKTIEEAIIAAHLYLDEKRKQ